MEISLFTLLTITILGNFCTSTQDTLSIWNSVTKQLYCLMFSKKFVVVGSFVLGNEWFSFGSYEGSWRTG
jgi:hypothetical protein